MKMKNNVKSSLKKLYLITGIIIYENEPS
jgi:hypothetical protein